ncbi:hypothetical protein DV737_g4400, partial [Chaetothyriales sp. CBS 132003]
MPFQVTAVRPRPRIGREQPAPSLPKLKLSELQLAILSRKSAEAPAAPATSSSSPPLPSPADPHEPHISRGPLCEMKATALLAAGQRTPLIRFLGKRSIPKAVDHAPHAHPASPTHTLPDSFAHYRSKAQQHGPLGSQGSGPAKTASTAAAVAGGPAPPRVGPALGRIGGKPGADLGPVQPAAGEFFDRSELPRRFRKLEWTEEEIEAVNSGGATSIKSQLSYNFKLLATIFFAHFFAVRIEAEVKFYRFFADVVNDLAFVLDVLSPSLPAPLLRVPALCLASACRAVCGVCGGSSKAILSAHFATRGNIGELNAKDGSQETVVSLLGMWVGGLLVSKVEGRWPTWAWLLGLLAVHLWANWRAVKSVRLRTLNRASALLVLEKCVRGEDDGVGVEEVGRAEKLWGGQDGLMVGGRRWKIKFAGVGDLLQALKWETRERSLGGRDGILRELLHVFSEEKYVLWFDQDRQEAIIVLKKGAIPETQLQSWYHAIHVVGNHALAMSEDAILKTLSKTLPRSKQGWKETEELLRGKGWQIQDSNLEIPSGPRLHVATD